MSKKRQNTKTGFFFGAIIFGGLGIFLLFSWVQSMQMLRASKSWPSVSGAVFNSRVLRVLKSTSKSEKRHYTYQALVKYNYSVEGQNYTESRISFGDYASSSPGHARNVVAAYPVGKHVQVYFDPERPMHAVLERRVGFGNVINVLVGFMFLIGGIALLFTFFVKLFTGK